MSWTREDTERWLNDFPLPRDLVVRGEKVWPKYTLKKGYGFWLRTAGPYHKPLRGLFTLCHEMLAAVPEGYRMPYPEELGALILNHVSAQADLPLHKDDVEIDVRDKHAADEAGQEYSGDNHSSDPTDPFESN
jgi:hypothetical protein